MTITRSEVSFVLSIRPIRFLRPLLPLPLPRTRLPPLNVRIAEVLARNHTIYPKGNEDNEERDKDPHDDIQNYV